MPAIVNYGRYRGWHTFFRLVAAGVVQYIFWYNLLVQWEAQQSSSNDTKHNAHLSFHSLFKSRERWSAWFSIWHTTEHFSLIINCGTRQKATLCSRFISASLGIISWINSTWTRGEKRLLYKQLVCDWETLGLGCLSVRTGCSGTGTILQLKKEKKLACPPQRLSSTQSANIVIESNRVCD